MKKLIDGKLIDISTTEQQQIESHIQCMHEQYTNTNQPLDRSRITDDIKQQLKQLVIKLPEAKVLVVILLGKAEADKLLKDI